MVGLGTLINCGGVIVGGLLGKIFKKALKQRFQDIMMIACGVSTVFIGASGAIERMIGISSSQTLMMIFALCIGGLIGEFVDIDGHTEKLGEWLKVKSRSTNDPKFVEGFASASLTICIGAMAVIGPIRDALYHDYTILLTKTVLDTVIVLALSASFGKGCIFSALPLAAVQGMFTALAKLCEPILTEQALFNISLVGSILIFCVGINLVFGKKIKVANLLPSLIIAVAWAFLPL